MSNTKIVNDLIITLQKYIKEQGIETYRRSTLICDIIYFLGTSIDVEKYRFHSGYEKFISVVKIIIEEEYKNPIIRAIRKLHRYNFINGNFKNGKELMAKDRKIYRFKTKRSNPELTKMKDMKKGNIFYMEEPDGEVVVDAYGNFIFRATGDPIKLHNDYAIPYDIIE